MKNFSVGDEIIYYRKDGAWRGRVEKVGAEFGLNFVLVRFGQNHIAWMHKDTLESSEK